MIKNKIEKYIVSGVLRYRFSTLNLKIRVNKKRRIEKDKNGGYTVVTGDRIFAGELVQKKQNKYTVELNGNCYEFYISRESAFKRKALRAIDTDGDRPFQLKSPMPGKICEVFVSKGSQVKKGEPLLILEAMKMQNQVLASVDAVVLSVCVKKDDTVLCEQLLLELEQQ